MREAVIVAAARSPIGSLRGLGPADVLSSVVRAALDRVPALEPACTDDLYVGSAYARPDTAVRVAARLGLGGGPTALVSGFAASSMQTARMAVHAIRAGEGDAYISAGTDSGTPRSSRRGGLAGARCAGGRTREHDDARRAAAEHAAARHRISRQEQDDWLLRSRLLAEQATTAGFYLREIVPVRLPSGRVVDRDAGVAADGAAATVILSDVYARELGLTPLARVVATAVAPAVVECVRRALFQAGLCAGEVDLWEIDEASAAETIAAHRSLRIDVARLNVHGGALALGHAAGMTGARIVTTLLNGLISNDLALGLAAVGTPSGQAMSLIVERL
ncbi:acetyl-CoA C-acyltransferase [Actinoplanes sp. CA-142083]|uniref:thiolase family protein n=1 Tax=Actinoplanes sp. CA-142083 TaxID=3239903 RepID=UPI003D8A1C01